MLRPRLGFAVLALTAVLLGSEVFLRIFPSLSPEPWALERLRLLGPDGSTSVQQMKTQVKMAAIDFVPDPFVGATLAHSQRKVIKTLDYTYLWETDSHGFSNREPWPDQVDAVVLGDSLVVGAGLGIDGQFSTLLSGHLGGRSVLNLGVPGSGTEIQCRLFQKYGAARRPKVVIAILWPAWDIDNTVKFASWLSERSTAGFTEYRLAYEKTHAAPKPVRGRLANVLWKSAVIRAAYLSVKALTTPSRPPDDVVTFPTGEQMYLSISAQLRLPAGIKRRGVPNVDQLLVEPLSRLQQLVEQGGGHLLVVLVPSREELYKTASTPGILNTIYAVRPLLKAARLPVLDLYPFFEARAMERQIFFSRDIHLNAAGNEMLAAAIAERVEADGLFDRTSNAPAPAPLLSTVPDKARNDARSSPITKR